MAEIAQIAVIGGSGLYAMGELTGIERHDVDTPFGSPSDTIAVGTLGTTRVAFLPRHGVGHRLSPTAVPTRANIYALKSLGVRRVIAVSAVGSLREQVAPLDLLVPDQLIDRTVGRPRTFFDEQTGCVAHVGFAEPFCPDLRGALLAAASTTGAQAHDGGAYLCIEGPQFSTRAESLLYRQWGAAVIGMTALPEARLAREAELCYAVLALVTDFDAWKADEQPVSARMVVERLRQNVVRAQQVIAGTISALASAPNCACGSALRDAVMTLPGLIPAASRQRLDLLLRSDPQMSS